MPYFVYIIQSEVDGGFYIGSCTDIPLRIKRHDDGLSRSTKAKRPWKFVYSETYENKSLALRREREIKLKKSRKYIENLIKHAGGRPAKKKPPLEGVFNLRRSAGSHLHSDIASQG
jgi:putative endonuclease